jgi:ferredoxin
LVGAALSGTDEVSLIKGRCSNCRLKSGEALLDDAISISTVMLEGMGLSDFSIRLEVAEKKGERRLGRRDIFSIFGNGPAAAAGGFSTETEEGQHESESENLTLRGQETVGTPPRRNSLRRLLEDIGRKGDDIQYEEGLPWARIRIDRDPCTACGTCVVVCPTGALGQAFEDPYQVFYFRSSNCTNCSLCREACPERAVEFEERINMADILDERWKIIGRIELTSCSFCGERIPTGEDEICPTCEKRWVGASWAGLQG